MVCDLTYLVGLPSNFPYTPNPHAHPKSFEIWPTFLVEGERPGASGGEPKKRESVYIIPHKHIAYLYLSPGTMRRKL
jgi:hypothetical protein